MSITSRHLWKPTDLRPGTSARHDRRRSPSSRSTTDGYTVSIFTAIRESPAQGA